MNSHSFYKTLLESEKANVTVDSFDHEVSLFRDGESPMNPETKTFLEIYQATKTEVHKEKVERVRRLKKAFKSATSDERKAKEEEWKKGKKKLPCFTASGTFSYRNKNSLLAHSGIIQGDIDGKENLGKSLAEMRAVVKADPAVFAFWVSPSGDGIKFFSRTSPDPAKHAGSFLAIEKYYADHGIVIDEHCKDVSRACFVSSDPDAFFKPYDEAQEVIPLIPKTTEPDHREWEGEGVSYPLEVAKRALEAIKEKTGRPPYDLWLGLTAGMSNSYGSEGLATMEEVFPGEREGEYQDKLPHLPEAHNAGYVFNQAKEAGWEATREEKAALVERLKKDPMETARGVTLPANGGPMFNPSAIFYDSRNGAYLVDTGKIFRRYGRRAAVKDGVVGFFQQLGMSDKEAKELATEALICIETKQAVDWAGSIAGKQRGALKLGNLECLILDAPDLPSAKAGDFPTILSLLEQAWPDPEEREFSLSWLSGRMKAVRAGVHQPSPLLVLAGQANAGKSLLAYLIKLCLGGRETNPMGPWSGATQWTDNLLASELLLIDDSNAPLGHRERQNLKSNFKEFIFGDGVTIYTRNTSAITARPVSAVVVCCNKTPEALAAIPPIEEDSEDKIALVMVSKVNPPIATDTPEGRVKLQEVIQSELPGFLHYLDQWEIPQGLRETRTGVRAWKNPALLEIIKGNTPESALEELMLAAGNHGILPSGWYTAGELASRLKDSYSPVKSEATNLLSYHTTSGKYLTALRERGSAVVTETKTVKGNTNYRIEIPPTESDCF
jgi:hypothetical protein